MLKFFFKTIAPLKKMSAMVFCFFISLIVSAQFIPSNRSIEKTNTLINQLYGDDVELASLQINSNYQSIKRNGEILGYSCIEEAPSKHDKFEFVILYDKSLNIIQVKVLIYREDYGFEIKSKRWLKQFTSRKISKVQAISGATISVNSLKYAVDRLNKKMRDNILK
ncbi:MAG: FMN-binding protein [Bacteroidota bacterium]|nr:FMN-binding protein [Bacteroidota bacterium]